MDTRKIMNELNDLLLIVESCYMKIAKENNFTYNELMLLLMIDGYDNVTQKQVCETLFLPKSSVHCMLEKLINNDILILTKGSNNKEKYIIPTNNGINIINKVVKEVELMERNTINSISNDEIINFVTTTRKLTTKMKTEVGKLYE